MKVVLVYPDLVDVSQKYKINTLSKYPSIMPLGILYLAAELERKKHEVKIYDNALCEFSIHKLVQLIIRDKPDTVGFSVTFKNIGNARKIAKKIKAQNKKIKIIFGGPQASIFPKENILHPFVDLVIIGEAEHALPKILEYNFTNLKDLPGLVYKDPSGNIISTGKATMIKDLDSLAYPARHLVDIKKYKIKGPTIPVFTMITSRGCPYRCTFCSLSPYNKKYRTRSPLNVVDEIEYLVKAYGAKSIAFMEDNFVVHKKRTHEICEEILRRNIKIKWTCETRVNNVTPDLLAKMKEAGLKTIFFGVESGSQRILNFLKKDITLEQIKRAFSWCKELGIGTFASFMLGIPGETKKDIFDSFDFMCSLKPAQFSFQTYVGMPGSELYNYIKKKKLYAHLWESSLLVSTPELPRKETINMEKEISFRAKLFKLFNIFQINFPSGNHNYHYNQHPYKNAMKKLTRALSCIKEKPEKSIKSLQRVSLDFEKIKQKDTLAKKILVLIHIIMGLVYYLRREKDNSKNLAKKALALDNNVKIPYYPTD